MTKKELSMIDDLDDSAVQHAIECLLHSDSADTSDLIVAYYRAVEALKLSKLLHPRIITKEDFEGSDQYGYIPSWCEDLTTGEVYCECILIGALDDPFRRYWNSKPSIKDRIRRMKNEQREKRNNTL